MIELALVDHVYEVVHFLGVSKVSGPYFELYVLVLDSLDEIGEEYLHFIKHAAEFRDFGVRIFVKNVFDFAPFHFFAIFVEEGTLLAIIESGLADETRLTTLGVDTDHETFVSINTLRQSFEMFV